MRGKAHADGDGVLMKVNTDDPHARWRCGFDARLSPETARDLGMQLIEAAGRAEDE